MNATNLSSINPEPPPLPPRPPPGLLPSHTFSTAINHSAASMTASHFNKKRIVVSLESVSPCVGFGDFRPAQTPRYLLVTSVALVKLLASLSGGCQLANAPSAVVDLYRSRTRAPAAPRPHTPPSAATLTLHPPPSASPSLYAHSLRNTACDISLH
ncbi:unnamed protein product [Danaus chrysippus]|uniref:(African queen) hypothetical protein n=1 Tax=Danaus chrysippus TaxID=151541 RepID=A0A8J2VSE6_9NEOP|nr:unnamed protein product [Danaus chrysippus]